MMVFKVRTAVDGFRIARSRLSVAWYVLLRYAGIQRDLDRKRRAFVLDRGHADCATMRQHNLLANIQPQAESLSGIRRVGHLIKAGEQVREVFGSNTGSVILDHQFGHAINLSEPNIDAGTPGGMGAGIVEQIEQHLLEPLGIAVDAYLLIVGVQRHREAWQ